VPARAGELADQQLFREVADSHDAVVIAVPPSRTGGSHAEHTGTHQGIVDMQPAARLLVVGGAGALRAGAGLLHESPSFPQAFKAEAVTMAKVLSIYQQGSGAIDWTMLAPPPLIAPGERTGRYVTGTDPPVGTAIPTQDFAVAALDELERPRHRGARFTVAAV
ncbi:NAD(P)H-binding protein, partial [Arthrobacter deserti]|nr:NAD(P)H-binding protein [Arthrobacter deserti]